MKDKDSDLHGNAPDNSRVALLLIDVINDFEFRRCAQFYGTRYRRKTNCRVEARCREARIPRSTSMITLASGGRTLRSCLTLPEGQDTREESLNCLSRMREDYFVLKPSIPASIRHARFALAIPGAKDTHYHWLHWRHLHPLHSERRFIRDIA
jgi:hypothetical protein